MYESEVLVGERGQITIPKIIREKEGIRERDKVVVKIEDNRIIVEKVTGRKEKERLMSEGYKKMAKFNLKLARELDAASTEAWGQLDEY